MAQTLAQFGQTIKAKHPEYADMPDEVVGQKVLDKFPQYRDMVTSTPADITANPKGEGLYQMVGPKGPVKIPYSNVAAAQGQGFKFGSSNDADRFHKDNAADPNTPHERTWTDVGKDLVKGAGKGAVHTMSVADDWALQHLPPVMTTPIGQTPNHENAARAVQYAHDVAQTHNTAQAIGKGVEQAAEFMIPGGAEEKIAATVNNVLKASPKLAKLAPLVGKMIASAAGAGSVNAMQGGSFEGGAAMGAAGTGVAQAVKAVAPTLAEIAMGARATDRAAGRAPGEAILRETKGINPGEVAQQAFDKVAGYTDELNNNAATSSIPVSLQPGRDAASSFVGTAAKQNNPTNMKEIQALQEQITSRPGLPPEREPGWWTGPMRRTAQSTAKTAERRAIPAQVSADEALALRRGVDALVDSWNPNNKRELSDSAVAAVRKAMNEELAKSVPDFEALNEKISSLLPAAQRMGAKDLMANVAERTIGRWMRPTGAAVGTIAGGTAGYERTHDLSGTLIGAGLGAVAPEIVTSPTFLMGAARTANTVVPKMAPAATGVVMQPARQDADLKGPGKWASVGAANLNEYVNANPSAGMTVEDIKALQDNPKAQSILWRASDLKPGSRAMGALVNQAKTLLRNNTD